MGRRLDNAKNLYLEAIRDGNAVEAIGKYSGARYTQHSTPVKDGQEGFIEFFNEFHQRNPVRDIEIVRAFEDGQYVFLHVVQNLNDGEFMYVTADIFDTDDDGKLIEHWDMIAEMTAETISGHSQVDGPTEPTDLDKTEENKALVRGFLEDVLKNGELAKRASYVSASGIIHHGPSLVPWLEDLGVLTTHPAEGPGTIMYEKVHNVIGCGSLVAAMSKANLGAVDIAVIDLFRVEEGRIVEHWDVAEEITPEDTWVNSGKF